MPTLDPPDTMTTSASARERVENRLAIVADETGKLDDAAVAFDEGREHRAVGVGDVDAVRPRSSRQQLVAGHDEPHARTPDDTHLAMADRTEDAEILRPQHAAAFEDGRPARDVFADAGRRSCLATPTPSRR